MSDESGQPESEPAGLSGPVDGFQILNGVVDLPISTWRYYWEAKEVRHLGPMAQDWAATFGLGTTNTMITLVDDNGVALVSIQALYRLLSELRQEVVELRKRVSALTDSQ